MSTPIISVTGTKGKTTTVAIIEAILRALGKNTLKVDTTGHFINGERRSTLEDSKSVWGLVPSVSPGRYLWELHSGAAKSDTVAILECSLGSSALSGMGYRYHSVGVFLNVFEDHLGATEQLKTREDIATAKEFIFTRINPHETSYAICNADDALVCSKLLLAPERAQVIPYGVTFECFDIDTHLKSDGVAFTMNEKKQLVKRTKEHDEVVADLTAIPWTFYGSYAPSVWNLLAAVAALYGHFRGMMPAGFKHAVESVRLDKYGGRITLLENISGVKILADYAHEKVSLETVAELARTLLGEGGQLIGVVRMAHDRTDDMLQETGQAIGRAYDQVVVYDKIDGYFRQPKELPGSAFKQEVGKVSQIVADAAQSVNTHTARIVREDEAIEYAANLAKPGDAVVVIVNDDIKRSIDFIREHFKAEFV